MEFGTNRNRTWKKPKPKPKRDRQDLEESKITTWTEQSSWNKSDGTWNKIQNKIATSWTWNKTKSIGLGTKLIGTDKTEQNKT